MVKEKKITHILHAANPRDIGRNQAQSLGQAIVMLKNILDVCKGNDIKLINLSSWEVYSAYRSDRLLAAESLPPYPKRSPGETKFLSEILIEHYRSLHGIAYVNLRTTLVYGGEYTRPNFIFNFLQKAARSEKIIVHKYINGYPIIDLIHISDFCRAVQTILNNNVSGTFNIGSGRGYTSRNIAEMIKTTMGSKSPVEFIEIDDYAPNIVLDPKKMISLGWRPQIDLHSGIENLAVRYCGKEA